MSQTFYGHGRSQVFGEAVTWLSIESSQITFGMRKAGSAVPPVGGDGWLFRDIVDVEVVDRRPSPRPIFWLSRLKMDPFVLAPGPTLRIRIRALRLRSSKYLTLDDPYAARAAVRAAVAASSPLIADS